VPLILILIATITDIKTRKIKNHTTIPMILTGLITALFFNGLNGLLISIVGMFALGFIMAVFPGFACGGGDIKLAAGCGAWMGIYANLNYYSLSRYILWFIIISLLTTWFMTTVLTIRKHGLLTFGRFIYVEVMSLFKVKNRYESVPMAPFMLIAYISTFFILT
jgi:prepilin peptidase CpaA